MSGDSAFYLSVHSEIGYTFQTVFLTTREAAWYIISICVCRQMINFESFDVGSSYLHIRYISREYGLSSYMKVIGSRSRSHEQKDRKSLFQQSITVVGNNSGSIKHRAMKFACSMGFSDMVN